MTDTYRCENFVVHGSSCGVKHKTVCAAERHADILNGEYRAMNKSRFPTFVIPPWRVIGASQSDDS